ncbi:biotin-protein ligase [Halteromyces radiatus]|uniref:biotin-protein ligase n=1 Tax=Halteromyces radiatus TaxID=101107 RepID=UPI00221FF5EE|nr:biotin-protein ligase [Halteromyces radiatus]KAI8097635.1 biotin-protein ligase [Halteromyces radiatus]
MNILLYRDRGTAPNSVRQTYQSLKALLGHAYDIIHVDATVLRSEPWETHCAMLVIPGGRDLPYCQDLQGEPNQRIRQYVENGGRYLGICAGAYYGSSFIEFEKNDPIMSVCGSRELKFYPGVSRGTTYPGFVYNSELGARSIPILLNQSLLSPFYEQSLGNNAHAFLNSSIHMYYNGGGYFVQADRYAKDNNNSGVKVEVLARFEYPGICTDETHPAAVVQCHIGQGHALLIAIHPEYDAVPSDLENPDATDALKAIIKDLIQSKVDRKLFLRAVFARMGLQVVPLGHGQQVLMENQILEPTPFYLAMHESATTSTTMPSTFTTLIEKWMEAASPVSKILECTHDAFYLSALDTNDNDNKNTALDLISLTRKQQAKPPIIKLLYLTEPSGNGTTQYRIIPPIHLTPSFNLALYFDLLNQWRNHYHQHQNNSVHFFGNTILYAQVAESTQTLLDNNFDFTKTLPTGSVCLAANQIAGRGRGRNSWVSQNGGLQFSMMIRHSTSYMNAPVVFLQYLISLAVVESIRKRSGYEQLPVFLKWPNDIYGRTGDNNGLKKVGGLLVNSHYMENEFTVIIGCGLNVSNKYPTTSINEIIQAYDRTLPLLSSEDVLAGIIVSFESLYMQFCEHGIGSWFLQRYYHYWLHSDQLVTLKTHNNAVAKINGITSDYGLLVALDLDNGKRYELQPDGNSFDMMKGLVSIKE